VVQAAFARASPALPPCSAISRSWIASAGAFSGRTTLSQRQLAASFRNEVRRFRVPRSPISICFASSGSKAQGSMPSRSSVA
jgi:hypothetical protein